MTDEPNARPEFPTSEQWVQGERRGVGTYLDRLFARPRRLRQGNHPMIFLVLPLLLLMFAMAAFVYWRSKVDG